MKKHRGGRCFARLNGEAGQIPGSAALGIQSFGKHSRLGQIIVGQAAARRIPASNRRFGQSVKSFGPGPPGEGVTHIKRYRVRLPGSIDQMQTPIIIPLRFDILFRGSANLLRRCIPRRKRRHTGMHFAALRCSDSPPELWHILQRSVVHRRWIAFRPHGYLTIHYCIITI